MGRSEQSVIDRCICQLKLSWVLEYLFSSPLWKQALTLSDLLTYRSYCSFKCLSSQLWQMSNQSSPLSATERLACGLEKVECQIATGCPHIVKSACAFFYQDSVKGHCFKVLLGQMLDASAVGSLESSLVWIYQYPCHCRGLYLVLA